MSFECGNMSCVQKYEMRRVVRPSGLLLLHVNSTEDMPYRSQRLGRLRVQELEPNFYREANGQTIHFFSEDYCRDVLADWAILDLTHLSRASAVPWFLRNCCCEVCLH